MSNDRYQEIRDALAMGPTPGPWHTGRDGTVWRTRPSELYRNAGRIPGDRPIAMIHKDETGFPAEANARLIRACDPDTIRELLAERDQLAAALEAAREDADRIAFLAMEPVIEGFVGVDRDVYDYACDCAEENGRDEPNDEDHINAMRRLIDAAIDQARGEGVADEA